MLKWVWKILGQEREAAEAAKRFAEEQKVQIAANAERRRHEREENLQEGARLMAQLQQHRQKVEVSTRNKMCILSAVRVIIQVSIHSTARRSKPSFTTSQGYLAQYCNQWHVVPPTRQHTV